MKSCENCIHNRGCIDSANYHNAETCEKYKTLKPCPFCGSEAELDYGDCDYNNYQVVCKNNKCYAMTGVSETLDEVIKAWNRRADNG